MSVGTLATKDGATQIHGTFNHEEDGAISFTPDGATIAAFFQKREWTFAKDQPNYPLCSVAMGGYQVPAVKTSKGWVFVNSEGVVNPNPDNSSIGSDKSIRQEIVNQSIYKHPRRVFYRGEDITETGHPGEDYERV